MDLFFVVFISLIGLIDYRIEWLSLWDEIVFIFALFFIVINKIQNPRKARLRSSIMYSRRKMAHPGSSPAMPLRSLRMML